MERSKTPLKELLPSTSEQRGQLRIYFETSLLAKALFERKIAPDMLERRVNKLSKLNQRKAF